MGKLQDLAVKYNSDKFHAHSYIPWYEQIFTDVFQQNVRCLFEIGIGNEALMKPFVPQYTHASSMLMWREFFPNARIRMMDIDVGAVQMANELNIPRALSCQGDQSNILDLLRVVSLIGGEIDLIIDDGSHSLAHQILTFKTLWPYLSAGGVYVIEDVSDADTLQSRIGYAKLFKGDKRPDDMMWAKQKKYERPQHALSEVLPWI